MKAKSSIKTKINDNKESLAVSAILILYWIKSDSDLVEKVGTSFWIFGGFWVSYIVLGFIFKITKVATWWQVGKKRNDDMQHDLIRFKDAVEDFLPILARKKKHLVIKDDYGYTDSSKWVKERNDFLNKFNWKPYVTKHYSGVDRETYDERLNQLVDDYIAKNPSLAWDSNMSPAEYETFCADTLNNNGWDAKTTVATGDQGVDVIAEKGGIRVAIQCKKYSSAVGNKAVQEVAAGMSYWGADIAAVVSTAGYTRSARELASVHNVYLLHHDDLKDLEQIIND